MIAPIGWHQVHVASWKKINQAALLVSVARWTAQVALKETEEKPVSITKQEDKTQERGRKPYSKCIKEAAPMESGFFFILPVVTFVV